ncbi:MAG: phosphotransferase [Arachnia propionica]|uniref:phosphotransferase n=1 Tax=Arachnia propionica TaxID=1750 RepID=UPI002702B98F|nr:phosphotransferase [Arachnia propionica]
MTLLTTLLERPDVTRVWPGKRGSLTFEWVDDRGLVRAGRLAADGGMDLLDHAVDPALPGLSDRTPGPVVVHRYGRRAVAVGDDRVVKYTRGGHAAAIVANSTGFATLCRHAGLRTPQVLHHDDASIEFDRCPGTSLHDLGDAGIEGWRHFVAAWPELVATSVPLPRHRGIDEATTLQRWYEHATRHGAVPESARLADRVTALCDALAAGDGPAVPIHRDLHDKQLLWDGSELTLLDLDLGSSGEIALDLGNLWAHAEVRRRQSVLSTTGLTVLSDLLGQAVEQLSADPDRVALHRSASRLRIAFVHAFRPADRGWLTGWVEECLAQPLHAPLERTLS